MYKLPYPIPENYDPKGQFRNPGQTLPMPAPQNLPVPAWFSGRVNLVWNVTGPASRAATWDSPIFDLRPWLRAFNANGTSSGRNCTNPRAIPVWVGNGSGAGGKLYVQISNLLSLATGLNNVTLTSQEFAHISDVGQIQTVTPAEDITTALNSTTGSSILTFTPLGEGTPVRYWKLRLGFTKTSAGEFPFEMEAAYY